MDDCFKSVKEAFKELLGEISVEELVENKELTLRAELILNWFFHGWA